MLQNDLHDLYIYSVVVYRCCSTLKEKHRLALIQNYWNDWKDGRTTTIFIHACMYLQCYLQIFISLWGRNRLSMSSVRCMSNFCMSVFCPPPSDEEFMFVAIHDSNWVIQWDLELACMYLQSYLQSVRQRFIFDWVCYYIWGYFFALTPMQSNAIHIELTIAVILDWTVRGSVDLRIEFRFDLKGSVWW